MTNTGPRAKRSASLWRLGSLCLALGACARAQAKQDPEEVIADLDLYPFAFDLEAELPWFEEQGLRPPVLDYLRKRSRVDWGSLRGDVDPEGGEPPENTR